mmetsp:Transcript_595/g.1003  ORF Transcript_595/g.1003 Transcript_595/m.1003 type:complete len:110 (+) Transcript_595:85-414(+)
MLRRHTIVTILIGESTVPLVSAFRPFDPADPWLGVLSAHMCDKWTIDGKFFTRIDRIPRLSIIAVVGPSQFFYVSREIGQPMDPTWNVQLRGDRWIVAESLTVSLRGLC